MKRTACFAFLIFLIIITVFVIGCINQNQKLSLTGTVKHDLYDSTLPMGDYVSMDEYVVEIQATNRGTTPVTVDAVQIYFDGGDGEGLGTTTVFRDDNEKTMEITIGFGQTEDFHSRTNGYTLNVLQHTRTGKVALHVTFFHNNQTIDAFHAVLPSLIMWDEKPAKLPLWKETSLQFTRDYDEVMAEVRGE